MYSCLSILLLSFSYLAILNCFQFLFESRPRKWAKDTNTTSGALCMGYIYCLFLFCWDCLLVTVQDVSPLHVAGEHTLNLSKGSIGQNKFCLHDELNPEPQHYNNVPTTESKKQTCTESVKLPALDF